MYVTYENTVLLWKLECLLISSNLSDFGEPPQLDYKNEIYASIVLYCQHDLTDIVNRFQSVGPFRLTRRSVY